MQAIEARNETYQSVDLKKARRLVLDAILELKPCTCHEVAIHINKKVNQIVGRFTELRDEFVIIREVGIRKNDSNTNWTVWDTYPSEAERKEAIYARYRALIEERDNLRNDISTPLSEDSKRMIRRKLNQIEKQINQIKKL